MPYSPMVLLKFDEEKYVNHSKVDEDALDALVAPGNKVINLAKEAKRTAAEGSREKNTKEAREDATQDPLSEL